jgi:hypothetical protein
MIHPLPMVDIVRPMDRTRGDSVQTHTVNSNRSGVTERPRAAVVKL